MLGRELGLGCRPPLASRHSFHGTAGRYYVGDIVSIGRAHTHAAAPRSRLRVAGSIGAAGLASSTLAFG